jgi:ribosomal-protein-alanine N-acetyltransferase
MRDISEITVNLNNRNVSDTTLTIPFPYTKQDAENWVKKTQAEWKTGHAFVFIITLKKTGAVIGAMGLHLQSFHDRAEAGYSIAEPHWNKGYATEALKAVLEFGFNELHLHKIFATHMTHNKSSGRVMQKAGMVREARLRDHYKKGGKYVSVVQYCSINSTL